MWKDGVAREDSGLTVRAYGETFPDAAQANGDAAYSGGETSRANGSVAQDDTPAGGSLRSRPSPSPSGLPVLVVEDDDVTRSVMVDAQTTRPSTAVQRAHSLYSPTSWSRGHLLRKPFMPLVSRFLIGASLVLMV